MRRLPTLSLLTPALLAGLAVPALATTKGLNQIVTPDVMPEGILSLSAQQQDPNIADRYEVQLELGVTRRFEVAIFQGYSPPSQIANVEYSLYQKGDPLKGQTLLSTGFFNWSSKGSAPQPYLEGGYYAGSVEAMLGIARVVTQTPDVAGHFQDEHQYQSILGLGYRIHPRILLQLDYQAGSANSATAGFTYNVSPQLQFNPAVYVSNGTGHKVWGYAVLTWNVNVFAPHAQPPPNSSSQPEGKKKTVDGGS